MPSRRSTRSARTRVGSRSSNSASDKLELDDLELALPEDMRDAGTEPRRDKPGRAHPDPRQGCLGQEHAVPSARGHVALGRGDASAAAARDDDVHAATALSAARHAARRGVLSRRARALRRGGRGRRARAGGPRPPCALARPYGPLGPTTAARRAAAPGVCPPPAARAALGGRSTTRSARWATRIVASCSRSAIASCSG